MLGDNHMFEKEDTSWSQEADQLTSEISQRRTYFETIIKSPLNNIYSLKPNHLLVSRTYNNHTNMHCNHT